ncbi:sulfatase-like hydrolase/transferase [Rhodoplanes roseus]|uniref:Sulfatase N-terminal domain-containing protein n=1 Tax=Rhodoplanes roseus TaxID=29409 RepID=A0A327L402_9BRAD|nr:sulfatase-like hydrolase/transferase [Rhodoplanes roseus]RAI45301.1 hypothetical protein CH341_04725 [Rhodoplanes roseus]
MAPPDDLPSDVTIVDQPTPARSVQGTAEPPPDIILILSESTFPPTLHGGPPLDPELAAFFRSADGRSRGLRVETFGGMSWRTEFSVMTGIPTGCYGAFATHVNHWATGHVGTGLPRRLTSLGYRSAALCTTLKAFAGAGGFYDAIGFDAVLDRDAVGADSDWAPDRLCYARGLDWLDAHVAAGGGPAFLYVLTVSNHFPHDRRYDGGTAPPAGPIVGTEMDEYLRRLRATARDYAGLREQLARRFPSRRFVLVHFGDHQPPLAARLFGRDPAAAASPDALPREDLAYRTYLAIDGVGTTPVIDPDLPDEIEVAYLGTVLLRAAGLPLDGLHALRLDLMMQLGGRLYTADGGRTAARLNGLMLEKGLITPH